jgi:hypothetical protein
MVTFVDGRAIGIDAQTCRGQTIPLAVRLAQARSYLPPRSVRVGTTTTEDGPALLYRSAVLAHEVARGLFIDCDSNPVAAGTFVLNPRYAGADWALAVGSCG